MLLQPIQAQTGLFRTLPHKETRAQQEAAFLTVVVGIKLQFLIQISTMNFLFRVPTVRI